MSQKRPQVYSVNWNTSNNGKRYTESEFRFIREKYYQNWSATRVAIELKRGLWAIEVQFMHLRNNSRIRSAKEKILSKSDFMSQQKKNRLKMKMMNHQKKISAHPRYLKFNENKNKNKKVLPKQHRNRKFEKSPQTKVVEGDLEKHLKELMGL